MAKHKKQNTKLYDNYWYIRRMWYGIWRDQLRNTTRKTIQNIKQHANQTRKTMRRFF